MARTATIDDTALIARLAMVFRDVGFEGASLARLSEASGLQRASLYHRFPDGKQQMAEEVLAAAVRWTVENIIEPLERPGDVSARLSEAQRNLRVLYDGGHRSCLLNMLMAPRQLDGPFTTAIRGALEALVNAFARLARDGGHSPSSARKAGVRAVALIQGSLVLARGLADPKPFEDALAALEDELVIGPRRKERR